MSPADSTGDGKVKVFPNLPAKIASEECASSQVGGILVPVSGSEPGIGGGATLKK